MRPDCMNTLNQENESPWISHASLPHFPSDTRTSKFYIPFILIYYQKTSILQLQNGEKYKKIPTHYKVVPWKFCPKILRWCWNVKKMVLRHSKTGRGELCSKYISSKLTHTNTLVRKRWYSEYKMDKNICQYIFLWYQYKKITIFYSRVTIISTTRGWNHKNVPKSHVWPKVHYQHYYFP